MVHDARVPAPGGQDAVPVPGEGGDAGRVALDGADLGQRRGVPDLIYLLYFYYIKIFVILYYYIVDVKIISLCVFTICNIFDTLQLK
jgi:hypothetical protein